MKAALIASLIGLSSLSSTVSFAKQVSSPVSLESGIIYKPLQGSNATAGYGTLKNKTAEAVTLAVVSADGFKAVELHETITTGGMMKMQKVDSIRIDKNGSFEWKPGGNHVMLFDPTKDFKENEEVLVHFKSGDKKISLPFKIKPRVEDSHQHH